VKFKRFPRAEREVDFRVFDDTVLKMDIDGLHAVEYNTEEK
jgi:hypothetical protein